MLQRGIFILDIEIELAWGMIDQKINKEKVRNVSEKARSYLSYVICVLEKYNIPVTWSILGHLILNHCECRSGVPHPEMPRPSYKWLKRDWYAYDPCKTIREEPAFYGKDILDKIVNYAFETKIPHEFASHSFSHQIFGDPGCSREVAEAEVDRCGVLMEENYGIKPKVFIFPRNCVGNLDVLQRNGFIAFRGRIPHIIHYSESESGLLNKLRKYASLASYLISFYLTVPPPVASPSREHSLFSVPLSMCYNDKPFIPLRLIVLKAMKGLNKAIREKKIFYLCTHLVNFGATSNIKQFLGGFEQILEYADKLRRRNELEITTLRELAEKGS